MKTTIDLPDDLLIEAKKAAVDQRTTLRALIERALRAELTPKRDRAKKNKKIRWVIVKGGGPTDFNVASRAEMMDQMLKERFPGLHGRG
jgi:hypothetical protein